MTTTTTGKVVYLEGDALALHESPHRAAQLQDGAAFDVVAHVVNNVGAWGAGFTEALGRRFGGWARMSYRRAWQQAASPEAVLGTVETVRAGVQLPGLQVSAPPIDGNYWVFLAHLFAQDGLRSATNPRPFQLHALERCIDYMCAKLAEADWPRAIRFHMPRIGTGLGGGKWEEIEPQVQRLALIAPTYVYDFRA